MSQMLVFRTGGIGVEYNAMIENTLVTNEEKRVVFYANGGGPTNPATVTPETPLSDLNLNWRERDLPERERTKHVHRLHPYLGKFIPQLVEIFLRKYFLPGQTVIDPFAGSGTMLVQASELGINSVGCDISEFNVLLIQAKTKRYDLEKVEHEILDIFERSLKPQAETKQMSLWERGFPSYACSYLEKWFSPQALEELLAYRDLISNYENQEILKIILSRSARSARLTTHFDLDFPKAPQTEPYWCYKHSRTCVPTTTASKFLKRYSIDTIRRLEEYARCRRGSEMTILHDDSRYVQFPLADGIITSPPYVGLIDYHEQHRYAYELLGLEDRRTFEIGAAENGSSQKAQMQYQEAIAAVFQNVLKSIKPDGYLIVVAGDKYNLYGNIAVKCGVKVEAILNRHVNRRTGRRAGEFFESVFVWKKP